MILKDGNALIESRGVWLKRFKNGNGHLFFDKNSLNDINKALAEFYGEVLPDCTEEKPGEKRHTTAVSKDLQYYPTPPKVAKQLIDSVHLSENAKILEPSCGCGRIMDALSGVGHKNILGIELNPELASKAKAKGHGVLVANFLEAQPTGDFDNVIMNPPFYGKHYAKHVEHALKFLKEGGRLVAILPSTARYDHGILDGIWEDLPVGSFKESGVGVNTSILKIWK